MERLVLEILIYLICWFWQRLMSWLVAEALLAELIITNSINDMVSCIPQGHHSADEFHMVLERNKAVEQIKRGYIQPHSCLSLTYILESQNHKLCFLEHSSLGNLCWQNSFSAFKVATAYERFSYDEWMNWGLVLQEQSQGCGNNLNHVSSWLTVFEFMSKCADECSFIRLLHFSKYFPLNSI